MASFSSFWDTQHPIIAAQVQTEYANLASIRNQIPADKSSPEAALVLEKVQAAWIRFTMLFVSPSRLALRFL